MAISHDTTTTATAYTLTGTQTTSHVANASADAAIVLIAQQDTVANQVSGVTYGGAAMTRLDFQTNGTEASAVYIYFLDGISGGTQNVAMTTTGTAEKQAVIATVLRSASVSSIVATTGSGTSASSANPSWVIGGLDTTQTYMAYEVITSGLQTMTNTPAAGWTLISSTDAGTQGRGFAQLTSLTSGVSSITSGWTAGTSDDFVGLSVALYEELNQTASPTGIADAGGLGTPVVNAIKTLATAGGIATSSAVGTPAGGFAGITNVVPIPSAGAQGTPSVTARTTHQVTGLATGQVMGTPVSSAPVTLFADVGAVSAQALGIPAASASSRAVLVGMATVGAMGTPGLTLPEEVWGFLPM